MHTHMMLGTALDMLRKEEHLKSERNDGGRSCWLCHQYRVGFKLEVEQISIL